MSIIWSDTVIEVRPEEVPAVEDVLGPVDIELWQRLEDRLRKEQEGGTMPRPRVDSKEVNFKLAERHVQAITEMAKNSEHAYEGENGANESAALRELLNRYYRKGDEDYPPPDKWKRSKALGEPVFAKHYKLFPRNIGTLRRLTVERGLNNLSETLRSLIEGRRS